MKERFQKWFDNQTMILANADLALKVWEAAEKAAYERARELHCRMVIEGDCSFEEVDEALGKLCD